jgi:hypothetical protein
VSDSIKILAKRKDDSEVNGVKREQYLINTDDGIVHAKRLMHLGDYIVTDVLIDYGTSLSDQERFESFVEDDLHYQTKGSTRLLRKKGGYCFEDDSILGMLWQTWKYQQVRYDTLKSERDHLRNKLRNDMRRFRAGEQDSE